MAACGFCIAGVEFRTKSQINTNVGADSLQALAWYSLHLAAL